MEQHRFNQYLLASAEFYEPISKYRANEDDFFSLASSFLPDAWNVARYNYWYSCMPPRAGIPFQGWKIHVSTEYRRAREILKAVVPVLVQDEVPFKYTADARLLRLHNGKSWPRGKSGKFVTIYPRDERHFLKLAARLHEATREFKGPRVLSDRRYPGSSVLHYRYGTLRPGDRTCITGEPSSLLTAPDGSTVDDERLPYFRLPSWIHDPINGNNATSSTPKQGAITLKDGRYRVENALSFSNTGGVYRAHDQRTGASSASVVVKEARPHVESTPGGSDSVTRLKKEYRILNYCKVNRIAPAPIDLFEESEHWFLIQEYFAGIPLSRHSARTNPMLSANPSLEERQGFLDAFGSIFTAVAGALQFLHSKGVVVGDLSPNNILVQPNTLDVRLIDFEAACESGVDEPAPLLTPGFVPPEQRRRSWTPRQPDDLYALGAVMSSYLYPVNNIYALNPAAKRVFVGESTFALGFPKDIEVLILNLLADRPKCRPTLDEVIETLGGRGRRTLQLTRTETLGREAGRSGRLRTRAASIAQYIVSTADFGRSDRLFPADPRVYNGNPLSVAYGASGVAYVLKEMTGSCPQPVVDWIMDRLMEGPAPPPGLYVGSAGVAWVLHTLGATTEAASLLKPGCSESVLDAMCDAPDFFYGLAGWGVANLKFFVETEEVGYLANAIAAGEKLRSMCKEDEHGCYWQSMGKVHHGLAHGAGGVALFFLYLYLASRDVRWLDCGTSALDFELHCGVAGRDDSLSWPRFRNSSGALLPYWGHGSAGIGMVVVRYMLTLADRRYDKALDGIIADTRKKYAVLPGFCYGLSGLGQFMLDLREFCSDARFEEAAWSMADTIRLFEIPRSQGTAMPGEGLMRISCDLATGGGGVALFFQRLLSQGSAPFMVDELLESSTIELRNARRQGRLAKHAAGWRFVLGRRRHVAAAPADDSAVAHGRAS